MDRGKVFDRKHVDRVWSESRNDLEIGPAPGACFDMRQIMSPFGEKVFPGTVIIVPAMHAGQSAVFPIGPAEAAAQMQGLSVSLELPEDRESPANEAGTPLPGSAG
jgi:hypothetical protein